VNSQKRIFAIYVFLLSPLIMFSQNFSVSGHIKKENNEAISYANILVLKASDSTTVSGSISDESGKFSFTDLPKSTYKKPTLKRESDRLIFNVEKTSLTEGNVWDILKSTPGILMINDDISVRNASNIIYLINDKRVYLSGDEIQQLLSGTTASAVQAVEVITNPPAKYDAEGGAVINIKMSKNLISGYNGSIYGSYTQGIYPRGAGGTSHFFKGKKISFYLGYNYKTEEQNRTNDERINFIENNQIVGNWQTDVDRNTAVKSQTANLNLDYAINNKHTFSLSANGLYTPYWQRETSSFTEAIDSTFSASNITDDNIFNIGANADYVYESTKGSKLSFNVHHTNYDYDRSQNVGSIYKDPLGLIFRTNDFNTIALQDIKIYSGQVDLSIPLKKDGTFEIGAKTAIIDSNSDINQMLVSSFGTSIDPSSSGVFNYEETIYAAYTSLSKDWESWSLIAGTRGEYTETLGLLLSDTNSEKNRFDYLKIFPTGSLTHRFNDSHSLGLSYSKRIERPTYSSLNPFKFFFNDNAFYSGNPRLRPAISQLTTLSYSINDTYTFELYYRHEDNTFSELSFQDNNLNQVLYRPSNLNQEIDYGFDFILYKSFTNAWTGYVVTSVFNDQVEFFAEQNNNVIQTNERWSFYGNAINYFTFLKDQSLTANLGVTYLSKYIDGSAEVSSTTQVDFGIKKTFNKGKWVLSLSANDIFLGSDYTVKNKYLDQDNQYYTRFDNRWVRLGLRYNFGNTKLSTNENIKELDERNRLNKSN